MDKALCPTVLNMDRLLSSLLPGWGSVWLLGFETGAASVLLCFLLEACAAVCVCPHPSHRISDATVKALASVGS